MNSREIIGYRGTEREVVVKKYDFRRPDRFTKEQIRSLSIMHENAARQMSVQLSALLRKEVSLHVSLVDQLTFGEYMDQVPVGPALFALFGADGDRCSSVMHMSNTTGYSILDRLCGGSGAYGKIDRDPSQLEAPLLVGLFRRIIACLKSAWAMIDAAAPLYRYYETNRLFVQPVPANEMIVLITFRIDFGGTSEDLSLLIPWLTLEPHLPRLTAKYFFGDGGGRQKFDLIDRSGIALDSELLVPLEEFDLAGLKGIKPGDKIPLTGRRESLLLRCGGRIVAAFKGEGFPGTDSFSLKKQFDSTEHNFAGTFRRGGADPDSRINQQLAGLEQRIQRLIEGQKGEISSEGGTAAAADIGRFSPAVAGDLCRILSHSSLQLIACVLAMLATETSAALLERLSSEERAEVIKRVATLDWVDPTIRHTIGTTVAESLSTPAEGSTSAIGGVEKAADVLTFTTRSTEAAVIKALESAAPALVRALKSALFTIDDLIQLPVPALRILYEKTGAGMLAAALTGTDPHLSNTILQALTDQERKDFTSALADQAGGPGGEEAALAARERVIQHLQQLESLGEVYIPRAGDPS